MFNAANLVLIVFSRVHGSMGPQVMVLIVMAVAAAEVAVGLAILLALFRLRQSVDTEDFASMKG
jgi:NADH-quinone oxidoreductase subunit K